MITKRQKSIIDKAIKDNVGFILRMQESQVQKQSQNGEFLGDLAGLITKNIIPLASKCYCKNYCSFSCRCFDKYMLCCNEKTMGQGMINVPNDKKISLIKSNMLTNKQINKLKHSPCNCDIQLTNK